jgi:hypothetical protein
MQVTFGDTARSHLPGSFGAHISPPAGEIFMRTLLLALLATSVSAMPLPAGTVAAQRAPGRLPDGLAIGGSMDRFLYEGTGVTAVSFRLTSLRQNSAGTEVGVSLFPQALEFGALLLAPDLGPAYNISLPGATLLVKAGGSALLGLGGGVGAIPGVHLGGGVLLRAGPQAALRLDVIRHFYLVESELEPIWSVGLGFSSLPRLRT